MLDPALLARFAKFVALPVLVAACGTPAPSCSDPKTLALVEKIYRESLYELLTDNKRADAEKRSALQLQTTFGVGGIVTVDKDIRTGRRSCEAEATIKVLDADAGILNDSALRGYLRELQDVSIRDGLITTRIRYDSRVTDDGKEHSVSLNGHRPLAQAVNRFGQLAGVIPSTPSCTSKDVETAVIGLFETEFRRRVSLEPKANPKALSRMLAGIEVELRDIKTEFYSEGRGSYSCSAVMFAVPDKQLVELFLDPAVRRVAANDVLGRGITIGDDGQVSLPVRFRSEFSTSRNDDTVTLSGHQPLVRFMAKLTAYLGGSRE